MSEALGERPAAMPRARISGRTLARVFLRSFFLQAAWNPRGMQNLGFAAAILPALEELYPEPDTRARAVERHLEFFNCHPYLAAAILGGAVRLEEEVARGDARPEAVSAFKRDLGPPFAAVGDGFFWLALRPAAALAAAVTAPVLGAACVLVFLGLYDGAHLVTRLWLFLAGYRRGDGVVQAVAHAHVPVATRILKACGAVLAGGIAARAVLAADLPGRPLHALLVAALILAAAAAFPRIRLAWGVYLALGLGLALGGAFL